MHGGTVTAHSGGANRGSEFAVRLPLSSQPVAPAQTDWKPSPASRLRVLVIEDNLGAAKTLGRMLTRFWQHEVRLAYDGTSGLAEARQFLPDLILCDIGLPGISGYEVVRQLRRQPEFDRTLIAALTGYGQAEDRRQALEAGFDEHLVKPASVQTIEKLFTDPRLNAEVAGRS
jgi:CheY-like chemotaxis protein